MEPRNRTVVLRQQVQHTHHAEIPNQNSQSHSKCTLLCNKSYAPHSLQHPLRDVIRERINKHHNKLEAHPNPLLEPLLQPVHNRRLKRCWPFDLQGTRGDVAGWTPYHDIVILIYLLTAIGLSLGGSSTVHIYTQTIHRTTQNKQIHRTTEQFGKVRAVPRLG